jgi:hypothetical protein
MLCLLVPEFGQLGIGATLAARPPLVPQRIVLRLTVSDKIELHRL